MDHRFQRYTKATACTSPFTPWCYDKVLNSKKWSMANSVQASSPTSAIITQTNQHTFIVDLILRSCTCGHFQSNGIPCSHAFSFICYLQSCFSNHSSPGDYILQCFSTSCWQQTYISNLSPISLTDITLLSQVTAPSKERKTLGRPKVKRFTRGEQRKIGKAQARLNNNAEIAPDQGEGSQACGNCGGYGHNSRSCKENKII